MQPVTPFPRREGMGKGQTKISSPPESAAPALDDSR